MCHLRGRSWWLQPLARWEDVRVDGLKESSRVRSHLTTHWMLKVTAAETLALPARGKKLRVGRRRLPRLAGESPLRSHPRYPPCVTVIPLNFSFNLFHVFEILFQKCIKISNFLLCKVKSYFSFLYKKGQLIFMNLYL